MVPADWHFGGMKMIEWWSWFRVATASVSPAFRSVLRRRDGHDAGATQRARVAVLQPIPYALLAKLVVVARYEEDAGLLRDLFRANRASKFLEGFFGEC
jgi:hypothetical protein